jgi:soluble epoxide hydrolase/lipid-phosphate phosphatase
MFHLVFATNASAWGTDFADLSSARTWLNANTTTPLPSWLSPSYKANWLRQFSQPNAVEATLNYYKAFLRGVNSPDEEVLTDEDRTIRVPVLAVIGTTDSITHPEQQKASFEPWAKAGFEQRVLDGGHWVPLEQGEELGELLVEFAGSD